MAIIPLILVFLLTKCRFCESIESSELDEESFSIGDECLVKNENNKTLGDGICIHSKSCIQNMLSVYNICPSDDEQPIVCCQITFKAEDKCTEYRTVLNSGIRKKRLAARINIVGGFRTKMAEFPHMAAIGWSKNRETPDYKCGGSLISENFVLTAAHCQFDGEYNADTVRIGDDRAVYITTNIKTFIRHPDYKTLYTYNDIALVELDRKVLFNANIHPACLWTKSNIPNSPLTVTGWGSTSFAGPTSDNLLKANIIVVSQEACRKIYGESRKYNNGIIASQICAGDPAGEQDTCQGDSGGPLQLKDGSIYQIVGITSFGRSCAGVNNPAVYTNVYSFLPWIDSIVWS